LDRKNEKDIQEAINKISKGKVLITVAHRIKTIKDFDIIFVINDGIVVEKGKFK
jgi:ATP-binding cassette subfamily B protein IrtB